MIFILCYGYFLAVLELLLLLLLLVMACSCKITENLFSLHSRKSIHIYTHTLVEHRVQALILLEEEKETLARLQARRRCIPRDEIT